MNTGIETRQGTFKYAKMHIFALPIYQGEQHFLCRVTEIASNEETFQVIVYRDFQLLEYGETFSNKFKFPPLIKNPLYLNKNIFIFPDAQIKKGCKISFVMNSNQIIKQMKSMNIPQDSISYKLSKHNQKIEITLHVKQKLMTNDNKDIYGIMLTIKELVNLKTTIIAPKTKLSSSARKSKAHNDKFINIMQNESVLNSGSSISTIKSSKDQNWNVSTKINEQKHGARNNIDSFGLYFNISTIILAIVISIYISIISKSFISNYIKMITFRRINSEFLNGQFQILNFIRIKGDNNRYDILNKIYSNKIEGYNITLSAYYKSIFREMSSEFFNGNTFFVNNYTNIKENSALYNIVNKQTQWLGLDGVEYFTSYLDGYDTPMNTFYMLSGGEQDYIDIPGIHSDKIKSSINSGDENLKRVYSMIYNAFYFNKNGGGACDNSKNQFIRDFENFKSQIIIGFLIFVGFNLFSLVLLYLSIRITMSKIKTIVESIIALKKSKNILYYKSKIHLVKRIINNESKTSVMIYKLKKENDKINSIASQETLGGKAEKTQEQMQSSIKVSQDDKSIIIYKEYGSGNQKNITMSFKIYVYSITILFGLALMYGIYIVISLPLIISYFQTTYIKRIQTEYAVDGQTLLLYYYIEVRYSILLNNTEIAKEGNIFTTVTADIYNNYIQLNNLLLQETNPKLKGYLVDINALDACARIIKQDNYFYSLVKICENEPITQDQLEEMIGAFLNEFRRDFYNFEQTQRTEDDIIIYFNTERGQVATFIEVIFFLNFLNNVIYIYLLPDGKHNINDLSIVGVIIFCAMVITEFVNYFISNKVVLDNLITSLNNYKIIEKFFHIEAKPKEWKKK